MFKRTGKNSEKEFEGKEEYSTASPFQPFKKNDDKSEAPSRVFEPISRNDEVKRSSDWLNFPGDKNTHLPHPLHSIVKNEDPETTLGEGVTFRGELQFQRLLRIDGHFEGELISQGKVIVGPNGVVKSNLDLNEAIIEGSVEGNITVKGRVELRGEAKVFGDIKAKTIMVDEGVTLIGSIYVDPQQDLPVSSSFEEPTNPVLFSDP